ncbi:glycosyltransferase [Pediococcus ethanolidurans]|uniref:glycosyltransferase n=1 Tax=Pediococcus ethanolidurans TaxID=319653 RepID=UPI001C1EFFE6|nr:glycosyltransferase [Pediococcus ethanolidurans]
MNEEKLSIGVVTYNSEEQIEKLLLNLNNVLEGNIEYKVYVIDNGSTDKTVEIARHYESAHNNIFLIQAKNNRGFGAGNNAVIKFINSDYHIVMNPDVHISSFDEVEKMLSYLEKNKQVGLLSPLVKNEDMSIQRLYKHNPTVIDLFIRFISPKLLKSRQDWFVRLNSGYNKVGHIDFASGSFMVFRTSVFKQIGGFDDRYFMYMEDADITRSVNKISDAIFFPEAFVVHQWQRESRKKVKYTLIFISSLIKYFKKWGWKLW